MNWKSLFYLLFSFLYFFFFSLCFFPFSSFSVSSVGGFWVFIFLFFCRLWSSSQSLSHVLSLSPSLSLSLSSSFFPLLPCGCRPFHIPCFPGKPPTALLHFTISQARNPSSKQIPDPHKCFTFPFPNIIVPAKPCPFSFLFLSLPNYHHPINSITRPCPLHSTLILIYH